METYKITLWIVFITTAVLCVLTGIAALFGGGYYQSIGIFLFYFNFINVPLCITFIFVVLYQCLFRKTPISFFKSELICFLIQIVANIFLVLSCPNC